MSDDKLNSLKTIAVPPPSDAARARVRAAAYAAFDDAEQKTSSPTQGSSAWSRLISTIWIKPTEWMMERQSRMAATAMALLLIPGGAYMALNVSDFGGAANETISTPVPSKKRDQGEKFRQSQSNLKAKPAQNAPVHAGGKTKGLVGTEERDLRNGAGQRIDLQLGTVKKEAERLTKPILSRDNAVSTVATKPARAKPKRLNDTIASLQTARPTTSRTVRTRGPGGTFSMRTMTTTRRAPGIIAPQPLSDAYIRQYQGRDKFASGKINPTKSVIRDAVSTFSIDVDTASYAFVRRSLKSGRIPPKASIRVEEMINYFTYGYAGPDDASTPFRTNVSVSQTSWNADTRLMHIGIKGFDIKPTAKPASNLVFLIDVSGSMRSQDKLGLLKSSFRLLVEKLDENDTVSIVTYAGRAGTALKPTKASEKAKILNAIDSLTSGGSTAGAAGIQQAYALAQESYKKEGVNRVILATDGDFNVGISNRGQLKSFIEAKRKTGVFLSILGFGKGNYNDALMQTLAQNGNGTAAYIDTLKEAQKVLVEEAGSTLFPIAKDVKIQVEFNPRTVAEYRLIGYETRALKRQDFKNDKVDAGDIGSGHTVTAIYEITPVGSPAVSTDPLRYAGNRGAEEKIASVGSKDEYAFVKLRYKLPKENKSKLVTLPVKTGDTEGLSADVRFSQAVAAFGQKLRGETQLEDLSYDEIIKQALEARGNDPFGYRAEFVSLVRLAKALPQGPKVTNPSGSRPMPLPR